MKAPLNPNQFYDKLKGEKKTLFRWVLIALLLHIVLFAILFIKDSLSKNDRTHPKGPVQVMLVQDQPKPTTPPKPKPTPKPKPKTEQNPQQPKEKEKPEQPVKMPPRDDYTSGKMGKENGNDKNPPSADEVDGEHVSKNSGKPDGKNAQSRPNPSKSAEHQKQSAAEKIQNKSTNTHKKTKPTSKSEPKKNTTKPQKPSPEDLVNKDLSKLKNANPDSELALAQKKQNEAYARKAEKIQKQYQNNTTSNNLTGQTKAATQKHGHGASSASKGKGMTSPYLVEINNCIGYVSGSPLGVKLKLGIEVFLNNRGQPTGSRILMSSGDPIFDQRVRQAAMACQHYPYPPPPIMRTARGIRFSFSSE